MIFKTLWSGTANVGSTITMSQSISPRAYITISPSSSYANLWGIVSESGEMATCTGIVHSTSLQGLWHVRVDLKFDGNKCTISKSYTLHANNSGTTITEQDQEVIMFIGVLIAQ